MTKLSNDQTAQFLDRGFLVLDQALEAGDLIPLIEEFQTEIEKRAQSLANQGKLQRLLSEESFDRRAVGLVEQAPEFLDGLDITYPVVGNFDPNSRMYRGRALFDFLRNQRLLDWVEGLVGPRILSNPVQHIRPKLPDKEGVHDRVTTPWHQDSGVLLPEADDSFILTVWIPLVEVPVDKAPLQILPGSHKLGLLDHELATGGPRVVKDSLPDVEPVTLPVPFGGFVLMHNHTIHRTSPNRTQDLRWTIDLRYQNPDQPTGRPVFPAFIARDRENPANEFNNFERWSEMWEESKKKLTEENHSYYRWPTAGTAKATMY